MTFASRLVARLRDLDATNADLARWLSDRGVPTTRQAVHDWATGQSRPTPWKWRLILDVLGVAIVERGPWLDSLQAAPVVEDVV